MVLGKPWTWIENASDPIDPKLIDPQHKNLGLVGYCIDLVKEFSERIGFDYELVISDGLGKKDKDSGMWTGKGVQDEIQNIPVRSLLPINRHGMKFKG